jgi:hypothetical protein
MVFSTEYKQKVFDTLQFNPYLLLCMESLESNNSNRFRIYIDLALDEVKKGMEPRLLLDEGDRLLWNGIVTQYFAISKLYSEFMDMYNVELDSAKTRVNG